jgi:hypothetical protein
MRNQRGGRVMTRSIQRRFITTMLLAAGAVFALPGSSRGLDGKIAGPTACQLGASTAGARLSYNTSGVTNVSTVNVNVVCTLVRDNTTNTNGLSDLEMVVTAPAAGNFDCTALAEDRGGNPVLAVHRMSDRTGTQVLDWGASITVSASKGYYVVNCDVPVNGVIRSIFHNEF